MHSKWVKRGLIYKNESNHPKLVSHAANPLAVHKDGSVFRCYFSGRDSLNRSSVGAVDVDFSNMSVIQTFDTPFFEHGEQASFYSHGVSVGNCYEVSGTRYMLFMGWKIEPSSHWYGQIGRLIVNPDFTLSIDSETPLISLDDEDPISLSYPWVINYEGKFRMWYGSTDRWDAGNGEMLHTIKYAESLDGHNWEKRGNVVPYELGRAQAFSRPTVLVDTDGVYSMWFSFRSGKGESYNIGYSRSEDGLRWSFPELSLSPSSEFWDREMVEYPFVHNFQGRRIMLYNGNGYGRSGFGYCVSTAD